MNVLYLSTAGPGNDGVVRRLRPADAVGAALRGVFGPDHGLPSDLAQLLRQLDRAR